MKKRKHYYLALLLIGSSLIFSACATTNRTGRPIDETKVVQIKDGITTLNDIISLFGAPQSASVNGSKTLFIYQYIVTNGGGSHKTETIDSTSITTKYDPPVVYDELTITFNQEAKVEAHSYQKHPNRK
jgi:hypothetical protein